MADSPAAVLAAWANFYVIVGSSAGALTGLLFIVITLVAGDRTPSTSRAVSTFTSPTVVHFCVALLVSLTLEAPWRSLAGPAVVLGIAAAYGIGYALTIARGMDRLRRRTDIYEPRLDDWLWYAVVPLGAYVALGAAAISLGTGHAGASFALAAATVLLVFVGIHNAWDIVTYIALQQNARASGRGEDDPPAS